MHRVLLLHCITLSELVRCTAWTAFLPPVRLRPTGRTKKDKCCMYKSFYGPEVTGMQRLGFIPSLIKRKTQNRLFMFRLELDRCLCFWFHLLYFSPDACKAHCKCLLHKYNYYYYYYYHHNTDLEESGNRMWQFNGIWSWSRLENYPPALLAFCA